MHCSGTGRDGTEQAWPGTGFGRYDALLQTVQFGLVSWPRVRIAWDSGAGGNSKGRIGWDRIG